MSLLAEIMGGQPQKYTLDDALVCDHVSIRQIDLLQYDITELRIGKEAMAVELTRLRAELAKERAAKLAILASWKYSMMKVRLVDKKKELEISKNRGRLGSENPTERKWAV